MAQNPYGYGGGTYNYYAPFKAYGSKYGLGQFAQTPLGDQYLEDNQDAYLTRWFADNGFRDFTGEGEFARQQVGKIKTGYEAALGTNPTLKFSQYMAEAGPGLKEQFLRLTPEQRGEQPQITAPRARYSMR